MDEAREAAWQESMRVGSPFHVPQVTRSRASFDAGWNAALQWAREQQSHVFLGKVPCEQTMSEHSWGHADDSGVSICIRPGCGARMEWTTETSQKDQP